LTEIQLSPRSYRTGSVGNWTEQKRLVGAGSCVQRDGEHIAFLGQAQ
jgi:hypothetical protein